MTRRIGPRGRLVPLCLTLLLGCLALPATPVGANTLHVTNCTDTGVAGDGSLRGEVAAASAFDTILFDLDCPGGSPITVSSTLGLSQGLQIDGTGHTVVLDGGCTLSNGVCQSGGVLVIGITFAVRVSLSNLTIQHGASAAGGGIDNGGTLIVTNSTVTGNSAGNGGSGGGIFNGGALYVTNSTITGNRAVAGGGIAISSGSATVAVTNSTITGNSAVNGGGISISGGMVTLANTIVASNSAAVSAPDLSGSFFSFGHNLFGTISGATFTPAPGDLLNPTPLLGTLSSNGGPTQTIPLLAGSPAIGAGNAGVCDDTGGSPLTMAPVAGRDQRGYLRQASVCSIGAYEAQPAIPTPLPGGKPPGPAGGPPSVLPSSRPAGPVNGTAPNPLPAPRP